MTAAKSFLKPILDNNFSSLLPDLNSKIKELKNCNNSVYLYKFCFEIIFFETSSLLIEKELANDKEIIDSLIQFVFGAISKVKIAMLWNFLPFLGRYIAKYALRSKDSAPKIRTLYFKKTQKAILKRRNIPVNNRKAPVSFLEAIIDAEYDDKTIAGELTGLTFASMFPTTIASQRLICDLLSFPERFAAIRQELNSVLPNKQFLSFDKIIKFEHIDSAIRETLRHRSHLPELWRKTKSPLVLGKGNVIPKETIVAVNVSSLHFDPTHYGTSPQQKVDPISYSQ